MAGIIGIITCSLVFSAGPDRKAAAALSGADLLQTGYKKNPTSSYIYNPVGKPDPFRPFIEMELIKKKMVERPKPLPISPLQRFSIDQFKLVGIGGDDKHRVAIVEDEKGKFYPLLQGTYIGQNNGRVVKILADHIIVEERVETSTGKTRARQITIRLHREEE